MSDNIELSDTEPTYLLSELPSYVEWLTQFNYIEPRGSRDDSKSPAVTESHRLSLSYFRGFCDLCMEPPDDDGFSDDEYGGVNTIMNADKRDDLRDLAELPLKFYNETKLKNFKLVKVCKINVGCLYYGLTFRAQEDGSEECRVFRGAICVVGGPKKAVFCEIKDDDEVTLLPDDDDYVRSEGSCDNKDSSPFIYGRRVIKAFNELPCYMESSDTEYSHTEFNYIEPRESHDDSKSPAIAESSLSYFRELCDFCMEPPGDDGSSEDGCGGINTIMNADKADGLRDLVELTLKFYNETKLKNFKLVKVCKINFGYPYYGLTFRAQEDGSEECPLFRGAVRGVGGVKAVFCEIKDDDVVTLLPGDDDYVHLNGSCDGQKSSPFICDDIELSDTENTVLGRRVIKAFNELPCFMESSDTEYSDTEIEPRESHDDSKSSAITECHRLSLSYFRGLCDLCIEPPDDGGFSDDEYRGVNTIMNADKRDDLRDLAQLPLKFYNETKLKNFKLVKVCKINVGCLYYGLTFRAHEDGSEECPVFRGAICVVGGPKKAVFCEIKDDDVVILLPGDDDYVRSEGSCDCQKSYPFICKNDPGDSSPANSGDGSFAGSEVSEGSSK